MNGAETHHRLQQAIARLETLPRAELAARWRKAHGCEPPKGIKRDLLIHSAGWHLQVKRLGPLRRDAKRLLLKLMKRDPSASRATCATELCNRKPNRSPLSRNQLAPGTRLVRDWNGRMHVVEVVEDGFLYDGKSYRSLSAIARRITGTNWSGPRFFGL